MTINCLAYQDGRKPADIPIADFDEWGRKPGCFVRLALRGAIDDELRQVRQEFDLHDLAVEDARHGLQRSPKRRSDGQPGRRSLPSRPCWLGAGA